jgi:cytochrome P450
MTPETTRPEAPAGFDLVGEASFRDPAGLFARVREDSPVFFYEPIARWIVSRREDVERWITDFATFSNVGNFDPGAVPEAYRHRVAPELLVQGMVSMDPPQHTARRKVAQRGFTRGHMQALRPEIEARAHAIIDGFAADGACDLMNAYALELTTQTICALLDLPEQDESWFRGIRFDSFRVLAAAQEPIPEDEVAAVWDRYAAAHERLREIVEERRDGDGTDVISEMARARDADGAPALSTEWIAMHVTELAAAGTDTTAQLICNAVGFLSADEDQLAEAIAAPELWLSAVEETLRRRPSAPFVSRRATRDVEIAGIVIPEGDWVWFSLASASNDPAHYEEPERFDLHRPDPADHLAFSKGRHACEGSPLARVEAEIGLRVLFERLPGLRTAPDAPLDFAALAMLPLRLSMPVSWDRARAAR